RPAPSAPRLLYACPSTNASVPTLIPASRTLCLSLISLVPTRPPPRSTLFPYTTLFRSVLGDLSSILPRCLPLCGRRRCAGCGWRDRKSTRLNSSHVSISYAVFCLKKKSAKAPTEPRPPVPQCRADAERSDCTARVHRAV